MHETTILVGASTAAATLGVTVAAINFMRVRGYIRAVRSHPYRYLLSDVITLREQRVGKSFGRPKHSVEIVTTAAKESV